jgi:transposase
LQVADDAWQQEGDLAWAADRPAPTGERWIVVRTTQGEDQTRATLRRQVDKTRAQWEQALGHLGNRRFACVPDARAALAAQLKTRPAWLQVQSVLVMQPKHRRPGRPRKDVPPDHVEWQILTTLSVDEAAVAREVRRQAPFVVATNVLDPAQLPDHELIRAYSAPTKSSKEQHSVERGFSFLKDPLFLASSVFVKKPERIVALSLVMVLCLLVYRLAEHRLRQQLRATGQTIPSQVNKPTDRPTMRWVFQCFEGVDLLRIRHGPDPALAVVLRLQPLHQQVLALLGPTCQEFYKSTH